VKKGEILKAVIVRTKKEVNRHDGTHIRFDTNSAVFDQRPEQPIGLVSSDRTRELRAKAFTKIISLAPEGCEGRVMVKRIKNIEKVDSPFARRRGPSDCGS